ncbi:MAG: hypothetical protein L6406_19070, partial [Desulfobacterales bacterium]|nr:hypothetical protein [Desulfobacterales bacterium]
INTALDCTGFSQNLNSVNESINTNKLNKPERFHPAGNLDRYVHLCCGSYNDFYGLHRNL